ncbi:MAG: thymidine phosphorylase [Candidatus Eisenbacteria bacterium]|nr:thymidine phosphorylase [Candidatus Eisenbacteria bacterium]
MRAIELIEKKKRGEILSDEELAFWIRGVVSEEIPDYQSAALLMAIRFRGLSERETFALTSEMVRSGDVLDLSFLGAPTADKHSTGGVGDKLSFIVGPLVAACGVKVPMLSGRALGHTGGTLDKLESIPGYRTRLPTARFLEIVSDVGISIVGQSDRLAPADGKLYALRDVTATVDSIPLIVSSILSKKIAAGASVLVFDVKHGDGAILREPEEVRALARMLVAVAERLGRGASALVTDMSAPLGRTVGNALEIVESIEALRGKGAADMMAISMALAAEILLLTGRAAGEEEARRLLAGALEEGRALDVFRNMIAAHGGDAAVVDDPGLLPRARLVREVTAGTGGNVLSLSARAVGIAAMRLGAGRSRVEDEVSPGAGIEIMRKPGDAVAKGDLLARMHGDREERLAAIEPEVRGAFRIGEGEGPDPRFVLENVRGSNQGE